MSYHFYDMGFKDGYKKALQESRNRRLNEQNFPQPFATGSAFKPLGGAAGGAAGRYGRRGSGGGLGGGSNQFNTAQANKRPGGGYSRDYDQFLFSAGGMIPYTQPGGFPAPRPGSPLEPYWVPPVPSTPGNPGSNGYYNVPASYDFNEPYGVITRDEWDAFRRDLGIPFGKL